MPDANTTPGEALRAILAQRGLTQTEFAKRAGWHQPYLSDLIHDRRPITADCALILERVLGKPTAEHWARLGAQWSVSEARKRAEGREGIGESSTS